MFTKESGLVQIWVNLILSNIKTYEDVPAVSNLRDVVIESLAGDA